MSTDADGETYYYGTDHIGSTVLMTDEDGDSVWTGSVTPFADQENASGDEHVMYTGKELDEDTGLYYYNARWYIAELYESTVHTILPNNAKLKELDDPNIGRFTTEDPIRDGLNWYAYAGNNSLRFVDPTGLYKVWGQRKDYGMTYGIQTQSRAERLMNTASNAIAGLGIPGIGAGTVQKLRLSLDKLGGMIGKNRYSIYKDTDTPSLDGFSSGLDIGKNYGKARKTIRRNS